MHRPPLPQKRKPMPQEKPRTTRQAWERYIDQLIRSISKRTDTLTRRDILLEADMTGPFLARRKAAMLDLLPNLESRYPTFSALDPNALGTAWVMLNLAEGGYGVVEARCHLLYAAALWVLDHANLDALLPLVPREEARVRPFRREELWHAQYGDNLIAGVCALLAGRNGQPEGETVRRRAFTNLSVAQGQPVQGPGREAFDALLACLPEEAVEAAAQRYEALMRQWIHRFFTRLAPLQEQEDGLRREYEETRLRYNAVCEKLTTLDDELRVNGKKKKESPRKTPLAPVNPPTLPSGLLSQEALPKTLGGISARVMELESIKLKVMDVLKEGESLDKRIEAIGEELSQLKETYNRYIVLSNDEENPDWAPLAVEDAYGVCFGLLLHIDRGGDLPWLYGPSVGLMREVAESLPWGLGESPEGEENEAGERVPLLGWEERRYRSPEEAKPRSLNQLLYAETGCFLPRTWLAREAVEKRLESYGVAGEEAERLRLLITALTAARNRFDPPTESLETDPAQEAESQETDSATRQELKRLRAALHDAEKKARDAQKALEDSRAQAELERRELADLRELVFHRETEETAEEAPPPEETRFPYAVQRDTLVFGGHDTWVKTIKKLLTGRVRFVSKDYIFDTSIIRNVDAVWIQPNALSHKQYYRIVDTARQYKRPVHYFLHASAQKSAAQLAAVDASSDD